MHHTIHKAFREYLLMEYLHTVDTLKPKKVRRQIIYP